MPELVAVEALRGLLLVSLLLVAKLLALVLPFAFSCRLSFLALVALALAAFALAVPQGIDLHRHDQGGLGASDLGDLLLDLLVGVQPAAVHDQVVLERRLSHTVDHYAGLDEVRDLMLGLRLKGSEISVEGLDVLLGVGVELLREQR